MKKTIIFCLFIGVFLYACKEDDINNKINPPEDNDILEDPVITAILPSEGLPLSILTIEGDHFSSKNEENQVTINGTPARVLASNKKALQVEVPEEGETGAVIVKVGTRSATGPVFTYLIQSSDVYITETYAGTPNVSGYADGDRLSALFYVPEGVEFDSKGNLIIADRDNHLIRKISPEGQVSLVAGVYTDPPSFGWDDGDAGIAKFRFPLKVAVDAQDNIYIADRTNHRIRKIDAATGVVSTIAGSSRGFAEGVGDDAMFDSPLDVAVGNDGTVYVADSGNDRIRKIAPDGTVSTLAGDGTRSHRDGTGEGAQLANPSGIAIDQDGNIIVADRNNHSLRKITPTGETTTIAGTPGSSGFTDGLALSGARLNNPFGVTVAPDGVIYVVEIGNHAVRMLTTADEVSTIGGTGEVGWEDGNNSQFNTPADVAVDSEGRIYVADMLNQVIRRIVLAE